MHNNNNNRERRRRVRIGPTQVLLAAFTVIVLSLSSLLRVLTLAPAPNTNSIPADRVINNSSFKSKNSYHFLISSDCTSYQRWEVLTQLHSAQSIRQCGRYTWIVSGCLENDDEADWGKGRGAAHSDRLTKSSLLDGVRRHFPDVTRSDNFATARDSSRRIFDDTAAAPTDECDAIVPHVHFTPDFSNMSVYGGPYADGTKKRTFTNKHGKVQRGNFGNTYPFNNKPNGLHHWISDFIKSDTRRDESVVLIDPDFLFLSKLEDAMGEAVIEPGRPAAAKYGLGAQFLDFNLTRICDRAAPLTLPDSTKPTVSCPFIHVTNQEVNKYYSAGPPYILHIRDVLSFSERWVNLVPPTYDEYPLLYAEMFAYSMAAADLNLKHNLIKGLFAGCMTGWPHTHDKDDHDALKLSVRVYADLIENDPMGSEATSGGAASCFLPPLTPPPFLHYCARYSFVTPFGSREDGDVTKTYHWFAKRHVDHNILDCNEHQEPLQPYLSDTPEKKEGGDKDWNVLAVCSIVKAINYAKIMGCGKNS